MDLFEALIRLVCLPYELWKKTTESSLVGASESEKKTLQFWKRLTIAAVGILLLLALILFLMTNLFF